MADSIHAPADFSAAALLGAASSAITGRVFVRISKTFCRPLQLYIGLIGPSGLGKSPVMNIMIDLLRDWLHEARAVIQEENQARAVEGRELKPEPEAIMDDVTPEVLLSAMDRQGGRGNIYASEGNIANILMGSTYR